MVPPGPDSTAPSRPLPQPPETGSAQTMAWNAPLSGPAGSPSRAPQKRSGDNGAEQLREASARKNVREGTFGTKGFIRS